MSLRTLGYFVAIAEAGSVSAAAGAVHVTQPALSRQIRQLEGDLGVELFIRGPGLFRLSAAGREFLPNAQDVLRAAASARAAARSYADGHLATLNIAAPATTLADVLSPFLATLQPSDPLPKLTEADSVEAVSLLRRTADLAIVTEPPTSTLESLPIASLPVWVYVPADHRLAQLEAVALQDLANETLLVPGKRVKARAILDAELERSSIAAESYVECSNSQLAQALARAGRGVAVVSDDPRFELKPLQIHGTDGPLRINLAAVWDRHHHASEAIALMARRLQEFVRHRYPTTSA